MSNTSKKMDELGHIEDIITPEGNHIICLQSEGNKNSNINATPFEDIGNPSCSRDAIKVRKNLFPSNINNEDVFIMDIDEPLATHLDHCGGTIDLVVDNTSTELVPEISSIQPNENVANTNRDTLTEEMEVESNTINTSKRKRSVVVSEKTPPKKRRVNQNEWKSTKAKLANQSGLAHISRRGKEKRARALQPPCGDKCRKKCSSRISHELREKLLAKYWGLKDKVSQWMFLSKLIKSIDIKRRKVIVEDEDDGFRKHTYEYSLCDPEKKVSVVIPVCQTMFLSTFDISVSVVKTCLCKSSPDKRGKHVNGRKRLSPFLIDSVKEHIKQFPLVPSHYCRADSRRKYLDENLTVAKMYRMYLMTSKADDPNTATLRQYRDIFNTCFNLSFFHPKKDQCSLCLSFDSVSPGVQRSDRQIQEYNKHHRDKAKIRELKKADKEISRNKEYSTSTGKQIKTVTFDMQKVLYCPKAENAEFYYRRKLSCFNFTVYDCTDRQACNYFWDVTIGQKGSNEVTSFVMDFIEGEAKRGVNDLRLYSDSCTGQNKNQFLFSMYYMAAMKFKLRITHRWLVKGHTQMECDSVHARIEKKTRNVPIYTPMQWFGHIAASKVKKPAYKVKQVTQKCILSFKELGQHFKWDKIPITRLREICIDYNDPGIISYRTECDGEVTKFDILSKKRGRPVNWTTHTCHPAYSGKLPIKPKVLNDLKWYVQKGFIPAADLPFYHKLFDEPAPAEQNEEEDEDDVPQVVQNNLEDIVVEGDGDDGDEDDAIQMPNVNLDTPESDGDVTTDSEC